jgi:hypothetical protein
MFNPFKKRPVIRIIYKSGAIQDFSCKSFTVNKTGMGGFKGLEWEGAIPNPMMIGVDDIAAVYQLK